MENTMIAYIALMRMLMSLPMIHMRKVITIVPMIVNRINVKIVSNLIFIYASLSIYKYQ